MVKDDVVAPDGTVFHVLASAGNTAHRENLPEASDEMRIESASWFKKTYACGHRGPRRFTLFIYGCVMTQSNNNCKCPDCCIEEIRKTVIRCASCELPILPGYGVVLYHPTTPGLNLAVANFLHDDAVMCCTRWDCCTTMEFFAGYWSEEGFKEYPFDEHD